MTGRWLVITADDFGYSEVRDTGIIECYQHGAITRASLMVNGAAADSAAQRAIYARIPLGLHFNITEGCPVIQDRSAVSSLLGPSGFFLGKMGFREKVTKGNIDTKQVELELQAQIGRFQELVGSRPLYVDGHQHVHIIPGVCETFARTLEKLHIHWTRLPVESLEKVHWLTEIQKSFYQEVTAQSLLAKVCLNKHHIKYSTKFVGMSVMGSNMTVSRLQASLVSVYSPEGASDQNRSCELMVHPGYPTTSHTAGCGEGPDDFSQSADRQHEMNILQSQEMKQFYQKHDLKLVSIPSA